jgi:hypothetical protein
MPEAFEAMPEPFDPMRILAGLRSHGVSMVLIGGVCAAFHGAPVDTDDVDVCVPDDDVNLSRLALALQHLGAQLGASTSRSEHQVSFQTTYGRLDVLESSAEFSTLDANAADVNLGRGVIARVASLDDLARLKRATADLSGAVRLAALADAIQATTAELSGPVDLDPPAKNRVDRFLERLGRVDEYLTDVNNGRRWLRRKTR